MPGKLESMDTLVEVELKIVCVIKGGAGTLRIRIGPQSIAFSQSGTRFHKAESNVLPPRWPFSGVAPAQGSVEVSVYAGDEKLAATSFSGGLHFGMLVPLT
ncbi:MAG TPA: hypothetical protein VJ385_06300 [Fibrobacteria bacterium]|nr:hypothetical protein [Fibrobacteria bacterium]